jgi:hypothetical protein
LNIGLLEVCSKNHYVLLEGWVKVLQKLDINITLYITEEVNALLSKDISAKKIIKSEEEAMKIFLKKVSKEQINHLIITSLQSHLVEFYLYFKPIYSFSLTVHNSSTWFEGNKLNSFKNIVKRIIRNRFLKKAQNYFVSSENMREYIVSLKVQRNKNIYLMPFMLFDGKNIKYRRSNKIQKVVYPGLLSATRKKYDSFFTLAQKYQDIEFVLLGAPSKNPKERSLEIIDKIKKLNYKNIKYFERYLTEEEYTNEFDNADFIFSDLTLEFTKEDYKEKYGQTKDTGISYLMIKNCIPLIVNSDFNNLKTLNSSTLYFSKMNNIDDYFNKYNDDSNYNKLLDLAYENARKFTSDSISQQLIKEGFLNEIN